MPNQVCDDNDTVNAVLLTQESAAGSSAVHLKPDFHMMNHIRESLAQKMPRSAAKRGHSANRLLA